MNENYPSYVDLSQQIENAGLDTSAAEVQGLICGLLCGNAPDFEQLWQEALFEEQDSAGESFAALRKSTQQMIDRAMDQFSTPDDSLDLMLPEDTKPVAERAIALRNWVQGFLYGFGLAGKQPDSLFSEDAGEAIRDFGEISRMDTSEFDDAQETEEALLQLEEYLWVAAMMIWHDVRTGGRA